MQPAMRMPRIIFSPVACPALQYFSTLSHKTARFSEKLIQHTKYVMGLSTTFV